MYDGSKNYYIGMTSINFNFRMNKHIADIKFNRKTTDLTRLNKKEAIKINLNYFFYTKKNSV